MLINSTEGKIEEKEIVKEDQVEDVGTNIKTEKAAGEPVEGLGISVKAEEIEVEMNGKEVIEEAMDKIEEIKDNIEDIKDSKSSEVVIETMEISEKIIETVDVVIDEEKTPGMVSNTSEIVEEGPSGSKEGDNEVNQSEENVVDQEKEMPQEEEMVSKQINGVTLSVCKRDFEIATKMRFNPFCYINQEREFDLSQTKAKVEERKKLKKAMEKEKERQKPSTSKKIDEPSKKPQKDCKRKSEKVPTPPTEKVLPKEKVSSRESSKPKNEDKLKPSSPKKIKLITQSCKVCGKSMEERSFIPDKNTFYCSTDCIAKRARTVSRSIRVNEQDLLLLDRKGGKYTGQIPTVDKLHAFLLREPSYEVVLKDKPPDDNNQKVRKNVRTALGKFFQGRFEFHDVGDSHRARELAFQVEIDLFNHVKSVRLDGYKSFIKVFTQFVRGSGKPFVDKLLANLVKTNELVLLSNKKLEEELNRLDTIEAGVDEASQPSTSNALPSESVAPLPPKVRKPVEFDFLQRKKFSSKPIALKSNENSKNVPTQVISKSAVDDILGDLTVDTTGKHGSHLYDVNCQICLRKNQEEAVMQIKMEKQRQKEKEEREARERRHAERRQNGRKRRRSNSISDHEDNYGGGDFEDNYPPARSPSYREFRTPERLLPIDAYRPHSPESHSRNDPYPPPRDFDLRDIRDSRDYDMREVVPRESWRGLSRERQAEPEILNPEIWFGHISGEWFDFSCALLLVRNRHGEILSKELKDTLIIGQRVPRMTVLRQIDALESAWDKQLISLLMQPPQNAEEYERFIVLYKEMDKTDTMFSVSIGRGPNVVDMFFYALPPKRKLHPVLDKMDGLGLMPHVQQCGNIMALVVRKSAVSVNRQEPSWREQKEETPRSFFFNRGGSTRGAPPSLAPPPIGPPKSNGHSEIEYFQPRSSPVPRRPSPIQLRPSPSQRRPSPPRRLSPAYIPYKETQRRPSPPPHEVDYRIQPLRKFSPPASMTMHTPERVMISADTVSSVSMLKPNPGNRARQPAAQTSSPKTTIQPGIFSQSTCNEIEEMMEMQEQSFGSLRSETRRDSPKPPPKKHALAELEALNTLIDETQQKSKEEMEEYEKVVLMIEDPINLPKTFDELMKVINSLKQSENVRILADAYYNFHTVTTDQRKAIAKRLEALNALVNPVQTELPSQKCALPSLPFQELLKPMRKPRKSASRWNMSGSQEPVPQPVPVPPSQPAAPPTPPPPPPPPEEDMTNMDMDISGDFEHGFNNEIIPPPPPPPDLDLPPPPPLQVPLPPPMIIDNILPPANFVPPPQNFRGGMKRGGGQGHCFFPYSEPRFPPPGPGPSTSANANSQPLGALNRFGPGSHRNGDPHEGDPIAMLPPNPANRPRLPAPPLMQQGFPPPMGTPRGRGRGGFRGGPPMRGGMPLRGRGGHPMPFNLVGHVGGPGPRMPRGGGPPTRPFRGGRGGPRPHGFFG